MATKKHARRKAEAKPLHGDARPERGHGPGRAAQALSDNPATRHPLQPRVPQTRLSRRALLPGSPFDKKPGRVCSATLLGLFAH